MPPDWVAKVAAMSRKLQQGEDGVAVLRCHFFTIQELIVEREFALRPS
jgi:hypothetical protein